ncbi:hybrid sensor histidine kinase/response regulator [Sphingomicrobium flavum]|uniref:hybrid sensor histidine kinase/response regulator n=1 Tax=Sphingomicrobium flavum TaxID=1229164 RepID=UPI0021AD5899|nr:PAS domain-containing sensor histidine kinase [Sphingomicrobium flavum]
MSGLGEGFDFGALLAIADALPVMIAYVDPKLRYTFVNKPLADWFEMPRKAILGKCVSDMMGEESYAARAPMLKKALAGERQFTVADYEHPTRGLLCTQAEYVPHLSPSGTVKGLVLVVQDVTEARAAEVALKESEQRFRRIADSAPVPIWVARKDGSREFINRAYANFFEMSAEDAAKIDWTERVHPDDEEQMRIDMVSGLKTGEPFGFTARASNGAGVWRWMQAFVQPRRNEEGEIVGYIGVASDITLAKDAEHKLRGEKDDAVRDLAAAQDQLRQAQKMEALGQLTGGIAHDFNNLLTVVVGGLDLISKKVEDERLKKYADNALSAAERGARLTGQLLAFSRVQRLDVRPVTVGALMDEMRPLLKNVLGPGIEKAYDLQDQDMKVAADPTQLEVAMLNLAINARDAMPDGGTLTFSSRRVTVSEDPEMADGDYIELSISDTGHGMPKEVAERAFDPFFTTKDVGKGTGLGLSMVYGMARQSGGTARIASMEGEGTSVTLFLKKAESEEDGHGVPVRHHEVTPCGSMGRKVLVVDDDAQVRTYICAALEEAGYVVAEAANGEEAMGQFNSFEPDVVVLDYIMPGQSGAEIAAAMRAARADQPILFVSGYNETDAIRDAAPDAALLAKPFRPDALDRAICDLLGQE